MDTSQTYMRNMGNAFKVIENWMHGSPRINKNTVRARKMNGRNDFEKRAPILFIKI